MFVAVNGEYAPLTDIEVTCEVNFETDLHQILDDRALFAGVSTTVWHGGKFTIPCTHAVKTGNKPVPGFLHIASTAIRSPLT
jgi:hypothetical protein